MYVCAGVFVCEILSLLCVGCSWSGRVRCVLSSAGSGPGYDTVFSVVLMRTLQRSDAGCKSPPPFLSVSGPYLDVLSDKIGCDGSVCFKNDTCKHGQSYCFFWMLSSLCLCSGTLFLSCSVFFLHQSTNVLHLVCVFYLAFIFVSDQMVCPGGGVVVDPLLSGSISVSVRQYPNIDWLPYRMDVKVTCIVHKLVRVSHFDQLIFLIQQHNCIS